MAADYGSTNQDRFHDIADSSDFNLPNNDWLWLILFNPHTTTSFPYFVSRGSYGNSNAFNLFNNSSSGFCCKVGALSDRNWGGGALTAGKWTLGYATRRNGNLFCGAGFLGEPGSLNESSGVAISSAYSITSSLRIGQRSDTTSSSTYGGKNRTSDVIFAPGHSITTEEIRNLLSGGLSELAYAEWYSKRIFHARLQSAQDEKFNDLTGKHVIVRNGSSYGSDESELFDIARDEPRSFTRINFPLFTSSPDVTIPLTGQLVTTASGLLVPSIAKALSGQQLSFSAGTVTPSLDVIVSLTGQSSSFAQGSLSPATDISLTGQGLSWTQGAMTAESVIALSGNQINTATSSVGVDTSVSITGQQASLSTGAVSPSQEGQAELTGQEASLTTGSLTVDTSKQLSGEALSFGLGTLTPVVGITLELTGQSISLAAGSLAVDTQLTLSGAQINASAGALTPAHDITLSGQEVALTQDFVDVTMDVALTGSEITSATGAVSTSADITLGLSGQSLTFAQGSFSFYTRVQWASSITINDYSAGITIQ